MGADQAQRGVAPDGEGAQVTTEALFAAVAAVCLVCVAVLLILIHAAPVDNSQDEA